MPLFRIAGIHSSLKSVNYCFKGTVFLKQKCKWKCKVIKIVVCVFLCFTERPHVNFSGFLLCQVSCEGHFFLLSPAAVPTGERCGFGTPALQITPTSQKHHLVPCHHAPSCGLVCGPMPASWPNVTHVLISLTGRHPALPWQTCWQDWEWPPGNSRGWKLARI